MNCERARTVPCSTPSLAQSFESVRVTLPPQALTDRFEGLARLLFDRVLTTFRESSGLAGLRDTLLPKLLSGEVRVGGGASGGGGAVTHPRGDIERALRDLVTVAGLTGDPISSDHIPVAYLSARLSRPERLPERHVTASGFRQDACGLRIGRVAA